MRREINAKSSSIINAAIVLVALEVVRRVSLSRVSEVACNREANGHYRRAVENCAKSAKHIGCRGARALGGRHNCPAPIEIARCLLKCGICMLRRMKWHISYKQARPGADGASCRSQTSAEPWRSHKAKSSWHISGRWYPKRHVPFRRTLSALAAACPARDK